MSIDALRKELAYCQTRDEYRLRRKLQRLAQSAPDAPGGAARLKQLRAEIQKSRDACVPRTERIPDPVLYPPELPVSGKADEIAALLHQHQVVVVAGDTGSGKTTQLPKICLQAGFGRRGLIAHTQPRRLAAASVASRIADELGTNLGEGVGYQVRFKDVSGPGTFLKVMTDGILLTEIAHDRFLNRYEVIIIDEAHERSLNIDFLLGFLKRLLAKRRDLKLIITSATIDVEKFSRHFDNAPIIKVSGRTFPVETIYSPLGEGDDEEFSSDAQSKAIVDAVGDILTGQHSRKVKGDILVFLSGEREIRESAQALRKRRYPGLEILPLYARLRQSEQARIFSPHQGRRVVLATNVAETSLTVPGINYVIDTGLARISRYNLHSKVQRLPIEPISQASANQRKGRCGRLAGGICIRLYSEEDFAARPLYTDPEIKRTNLASVILRMKHLRLGEAEDFPFIEPPEPRAINEGTRLLQELNALSADKRLTPAGRQMAVLPVDPKFARMLVSAEQESCLREMLIIVSVLSSQDPRELGGANRKEARAALAEFDHPESDFLSLVNLWQEYEKQRQALSQNQLRKYCKQHFLSYMRMREWRELHRQLLLACQELGFRQNRRDASYEQIHRAIISGSLNQIARHDEGRLYLNNRNRKFTLFPASCLADKSPRWIVTGELIETAQTFATMAAGIQPEWVEQMAAHLVRREYYQPHWSSRHQEVRAYEKVQLYGLTLIEKASVRYAPLNAAEARDIFIREALAAGQIETRQPFYRKNRQLLAALTREEEKIRRPDTIVGENDVIRFYEERLPEDIASTSALEKWLQSDGGRHKDALLMDKQSLLGERQQVTDTSAFPDRTAIRQNRLQIDYKFDPGNARDGATLRVPLALLHQLAPADIDWAVPGLLRDKCIALLKGLPKSLRKNFIPVSGFVDEILPHMHSGDGDLITALLAQIKHHKGLQLSPDDFSDVDLPQYLQTKVRVIDDEDREVDIDTDVTALQQRLSGAESETIVGQQSPDYHHPLERTGLRDWDFDTLPEVVSIGEELVLERYPALVDEKDSIAVRLFAEQDAARQAMERGLVRLAMLRSVQQRNRLSKQFRRLAQEHALRLPRQLSDLADAAVVAVYRQAFSVSESIPRSRPAFNKWLDRGKAALLGTGDELEKLLDHTLREQWDVRAILSNIESGELRYLREDVSQQLENLLTEDFLLTTPWRWLQQYPRYFRAIHERLAKVPHMGPRDEAQTEELQVYWQRYIKTREGRGARDQETLVRLRWMLEEFRVSLFAQKLGTEIPVSAKRIEKLFSALNS